MHIPMSAPDLTEAEVAAVVEVMRLGHLSIGPRLDEFEQMFAARIGRAHAIAVSSGTAALHLSVIAAGIRARDIVITSPFSFVASANCVLYEDAIPIFVDVDPDTGNLDPVEVEAAVADLARGGAEARHWWPRALRSSSPGPAAVKAVLPVHAFGQPADMSSIVEVACRADLVVIEDACEAVGAAHRNRQAGAFGHAAAFAFYPNKQMTTGEGGMIVTDDDLWADRCRSLRNQGRDEFDSWLTHARLGYNYRLNELACALGVVQLSRLDEMLARRARVAAWYTERLAGLPRLQTPSIAVETTAMSWFVYVVRFADAAVRAQAIDELARHGIPSRPYFTPIHLQPFYVERFGYQRGDFPVCESLGDCSLALPFSAVMTQAQVEFVCDRLAGACSSAACAEHVTLSEVESQS